ncbi:hypothetical protein SAMN05519103_01795 [Rhizobiales bacterium GAS113]|nr:hypothetical protein SAMN05519103_01795 [Rhizobiales bacterium GAS113]
MRSSDTKPMSEFGKNSRALEGQLFPSKRKTSRLSLHYSPTWKTFPDFLADYIKRILDPAWGNAELAKPFSQRHPIVQWYDALCRYQQATIKTPGVPALATVNGVVACYLGLAYSLYLLDHNVELQKRLVARLKIPDQFQGAYYELIVANILIRAGFELTLEDETDGASKHCEFAAHSKRTGRKYWVEAKMRSVAGFLGKTERDGTTDQNPISRLIPHLNDALAKPAADERLIFIDLNTEPTPEAEGKLPWIERAAARLEQYERRELAEGVRAYVFVTNFPFHRGLNEPASMAGFPFGLGIDDFNRPGVRRVSEAYRLKQKYIDAHYIGEALTKYLKFPATFDGSLPSEAIDGTLPRIIIGNTYCFGDPDAGGVVGTVTTASVNEPGCEVLIGITDQNGRAQILTEPMSSQQLDDYRAHKDSYFGRILPVGGKIGDPFELFEWCARNHKWMSREQLLEKLAHAPNIVALRSMSDDDLLYEYCELMVVSVWKPST